MVWSINGQVEIRNDPSVGSIQDLIIGSRGLAFTIFLLTSYDHYKCHRTLSAMSDVLKLVKSVIYECQ